MSKTKNIFWFSEIDKSQIPRVGGKAANLGELYNLPIPVPNGFAVSADAYFDFAKHTSLEEKIKTELSDLVVEDSEKLFAASKRVKTALLSSKIPHRLEKDIIKAYAKLCGSHDQPVAVRSSATAEDLPEASFAGQQKTLLNVVGAQDVVAAVWECWASLFEPRSIFYRVDRGFDHLKVGIAAVVQLMVESEVSGVLFTLDPLTNDRSKISIEAAYGLGESVVSGSLTPDQYLINKEPLKIDKKVIVPQTWQIARAGKVKIAKSYQKKQKLPDRYIKQLAELSLKIEKHYDFPQDIEWCWAKKKIFIVQTRPVTTISTSGVEHKIKESQQGIVLLSGMGASPGVAAGPVKIIKSARKIALVGRGDILVTEMTTPDFVPAMKRDAAIVTDKGGRTSHAAIVSRELGIPCVVGTDQATQILKNEELITVDGADGKIYEGKLELVQEKKKVRKVPIKTATKIYVNLGEPQLAIEMAARNVDGVGLLRAEFMIAQIGAHPRKFIEDKKSRQFVDQLAVGLSTFAQAFQPRPVIYRATDFKTNEYKNLKGGAQFEKDEPNPMIGFRGARRYMRDAAVFNMELKALLKVRNKEGLKNLHLMLPFVRTVEELIEVKKLVSAAGLRRSANFQLWMMVEIPSNVISLEEFIKVGIDGVSVGTNDLTMLTLGVDRDNEQVAEVYDELDPAVLWSLERVVKTCAKHKITSSICGQAPSEYPSLVKKLVKWGMTSVSVSPDVIDKTREIVHEAELDLVRQKRE
ncbi:phosphoenolpyruvate synthase [Candidatus Parcubacteria bacterium]|nr:phosphoenolpyruvate synthase [Candidatus Parcubacteria bacterium]